ncbi:MAG: hypothetical protein JWM10_793 [Myxococcaceae bacterium]|nr:hypothetical protein [Myxococcaceae bacterium]
MTSTTPPSGSSEPVAWERCETCGRSHPVGEHLTFIDLYEILPDVEVDYERYAASERDVITPALIAAGYELRGSWFTGDGDSFGPLTRCVDTDKGVIVYG